MNRNLALSLLALGCSLANQASAQHVISAHAGLVNYTEGEVLINDQIVKTKTGEYPDIKLNQHLRTGLGRVEILLTPGVFLRVGEESEIVMLANQLMHTRIELLKGSAILEVDDLEKEQSIELLVLGSVLEPRKRGVFRVDASDPPRVRSYDGEIFVDYAGQRLTVKEGREVSLVAVPAITKFSKQDTDAFYRWAGRRSGYLAAASYSAARGMSRGGTSWTTGNWYFNPYFGLFTYIPLRGYYTNAWNYSYYSPSAAAPPPPPMRNTDTFAGFNSPHGAADMSGRSYSGTFGQGGYQAPATSTPSAAASVGAARSGDAGGGSRDSRGGGR